MATTSTPIHSIFSPSPSLRLRSSFRPKPFRVSASSAVAPPPLPELTKSKSGIVLMSPDEKDKVERLKVAYHEKVVPLLVEKFGYKNIHQIPKLEKITVNCGIGDAHQNSKGLEQAIKHMSIITCQRPYKTVARKSVASFKVREGYTLGIAVTLRGKYMYSFLDRLINLGLPRVPDFQGINPNSFDGVGNYALGLADQAAFPELDQMGRQKGMGIYIKTSAETDEEAFELLSLLGMPFRAKKADEVVVKKKKMKQHHFLAKGKGDKGSKRKK
ncbi:hypothetical protein LUZ60_014623 [Juncus effusus]|nr:hypothetical protein LUZ60_014623 [Juncus effusus]